MRMKTDFQNSFAVTFPRQNLSPHVHYEFEADIPSRPTWLFSRKGASAHRARKTVDHCWCIYRRTLDYYFLTVHGRPPCRLRATPLQDHVYKNQIKGYARTEAAHRGVFNVDQQTMTDTASLQPGMAQETTISCTAVDGEYFEHALWTLRIFCLNAVD